MRVRVTLGLKQVTTGANLGVVASLLIAATHQVSGGGVGLGVRAQG